MKISHFSLVVVWAAAIMVAAAAGSATAADATKRVSSDRASSQPTPAKAASHALASPSATALELWEDPPAPSVVEDDNGVLENYGGGCGQNARSQWCSSSWYAQADALIWWTQGNKVPPLVTTSPNATGRPDAGVLGRDTSILHGGDSVDGNYRLGGRVTIGRWFDACQLRGIEVTYFTLGDGANTGNYYAQSTGDSILARPFFDTQIGQEASQLVAFPNVVEGGIQVLTSSELHSVSVLGRRNWWRDCGARIDLVGGYRFLRYREGLTITEDLTSTDPGGSVQQGTTFNVHDSFSTTNDFNGAEFGISTVLDRGCWSIDMLAKLALGNMRQKVNIDGSTVVTVPNTTPDQRVGGFLALPGTNMGKETRDDFAMIPELNLNLRYAWNECLSFNVGYSILWITDVARTGGQIDRRVNTTYLPGAPNTPNGDRFPTRLMDDRSMWAQGLNLGVLYQF